MEYSLLSKELTRKLSKEDKKNNGIYFTPPSCVFNNLTILEPHLKKIKNVLEPSCGSCEYITALNKLFPTLAITGIEYNETIYQSILNIGNDKIKLINADYLNYEPNETYDLIIGNPPYFVINKKDVDRKYHVYFEGRPSIFLLFIIKSIKLLSDFGILSFVLPKNFLNCLYYDKTRKYISKNLQVLDIIYCNGDKYIETQQDTIILIIQKNLVCDNANFILEVDKYTIFANKENVEKINKLNEHSKSLAELGFKVSVGNVVWNQCKDLLTDDESKTRLIYSSDIENNALTMKRYNNVAKKNFIQKKGINRPMIVINRGYGVGDYTFNYCLLDEKGDFLIENHLICINNDTDLSRAELIDSYKKILLSLTDKRTLEFIKIYFGNNAINTTELNHVLPIYQDI